MAKPDPATVKRLTLVACIMGTGIAFLDSTVVNVALPTIQRDLGGGLAAQQWVTNAYLLTLGSLILLGGSLGDVLGERRVFSIGVAGFGVTSLLCALAPTMGVLIAMRALQGTAGALLTPSALAVIVATFDESERGAAIGSWTAWGGIATVIGPLAGGELLALASWRWIFVINAPLVAITLALILIAVPGRRSHAGPGGDGGPSRRIDWTGATLAALGLAGPVFALIEQPRLGWSSPGVSAPLLAGLVLLTAMIRHESRARDPMLPLGLFSRRNFTVGNLQTLTVYAGLSLFSFLLVLFLQQIAGYSALQSGLATLPVTIVMFLLSRRFGTLAARHGPRLFMGLGPLLAAAGMALMLGMSANPDYVSDVLPGVLLFSLGLSLTVAPLTTAVLAEVSEGEAGIASAVNNAVARVAGLLATAAIGALLSVRFSSSLHAQLTGLQRDHATRSVIARAERLPLGVPSTHGLHPGPARLIGHAAQQASVSSFHLGMAVTVALLAIGGIIAAVGIRNPGRPTAPEGQAPVSAGAARGPLPSAGARGRS